MVSIQKWMRNHAPRSSSAAAAATTSTATAAPATTAAVSLCRAALGTRSSYRERASSASPVRRRWPQQNRQEAWIDGKRDGGGAEISCRSGIGIGTGDGCGSYTPLSKRDGEAVYPSAGVPGQHNCRADKEQEDREEGQKRHKVDAAFRAWLDRKKKQRQAERKAQQRREEALKNLRYCVLLC